MRKNSVSLVALLAVAFLFFTSEKSYSQVIKATVIAGGNLTQVDGDECYGYKKIGLNVGAGVMIPFGKNWDVSMEALYNQKGAYQRKKYTDIGDGKNGAYEIKLDYVEIPVLVHYTDKGLVSIGAGFAYGRLINAKEYEHGKKTATTATNDVYKIDDYSVVADLRFKIYKQLKLNLRYQYSMAKIRTRDFYTVDDEYMRTRDQYNNVVSLRLVYVFFEERSDAIRKMRRQSAY